MVGSAIHRRLLAEGYNNFVFRVSSGLDLRDQRAVADFFAEEKPDYVFLAAAKVGGIHANNVYRGEFLYDNLMIQNNVIHQSQRHGVKKLLFLGSSCIYPKLAPQPLKEEYLLTGLLEPTNEPYAIAKIAGIKLCEAYRSQYGCNFISVMPTNLYGPNDNYDLNNSHVLPALIRKFHEAKAERRPQRGSVGFGHAQAGIPARRRPGRRVLFSDVTLQPTGIDQHRYRRRPFHPRTCGICQSDSGLRRLHFLEYLQTGRHPPQADGRVEAAWPGVAPPDHAGRRVADGI